MAKDGRTVSSAKGEGAGCAPSDDQRTLVFRRRQAYCQLCATHGPPCAVRAVGMLTTAVLNGLGLSKGVSWSESETERCDGLSREDDGVGVSSSRPHMRHPPGDDSPGRWRAPGACCRCRCPWWGVDDGPAGWMMTAGRKGRRVVTRWLQATSLLSGFGEHDSQAQQAAGPRSQVGVGGLDRPPSAAQTRLIPGRGSKCLACTTHEVPDSQGCTFRSRSLFHLVPAHDRVDRCMPAGAAASVDGPLQLGRLFPLQVPRLQAALQRADSISSWYRPVR